MGGTSIGSMEVKLKDYLDGATVLFDAAGNVVDGRLQGGYISLRGLPGATLISQIFPSCGSCQVLVHYSAARAKSPSHRQAGMFPANGEERSSPLYLLKGEVIAKPLFRAIHEPSHMA